MPSIERTCRITGKQFIVSEQEQELRKSFGVGLPDISPGERMRYLMCFRNISTLYSDTCDLCGKFTLSIWGEHPNFPVYCRECWWSDAWQPVQRDIDFTRPFFDQLKELCDGSPHPAVAVDGTIVNSDFCNAVTNLKNCYMTFSTQKSEDCYYCVGCVENRYCVDTQGTDRGESLYECLACDQSFNVRWSEYATNCTDSLFLYDCSDCSNCALSAGLRHKQYVYGNEQLTKDDYEKKIAELEKGSYQTVQNYRALFSQMKQKYPKKYIVGRNNEDATGNLLVRCKDVVGGYGLTDCENCVNVFSGWTFKDSADVCTFGGHTQRCLSCTSVGNNSSDIRYSWSCYGSSLNIEYSAMCVSSSHCFGCAFGRKFEYSILNKQYSKEEYEKNTALLREKMKERGEDEQMFRFDMIPFAYNESLAQMNMPLSCEEAERRGFRWKEKTVPHTSSDKIYTPSDTIVDTSWEDIDGKVIICEESGRPFKIIKQEFEFYKKYGIPLPRLHWEVRMMRRYPHDLLFNLHIGNCCHCGAAVETSMPEDEQILCELCYQKNII